MFETTRAVLGEAIGRDDFGVSLGSLFTLRVYIGDEVVGVNILVMIEWAIEDYLGLGSGISFSFWIVSLSSDGFCGLGVAIGVAS